MPRFAALALLGGLLAAAVAAPRADDRAAPAPPAGTWKFFLPLQENKRGAQPLWLLRFAKTADGWQAKLLDSYLREDKGGVEKVSVTADRLKFTLRTSELTLPCEFRLPKDGKAGRLYGLTSRGSRVTPIEMERTELTSLDPFDQTRELLAKQPLGIEAIQLALSLLQRAAVKKAKPAEVRDWAEKAVRSAELYGPALQRDVLLTVADTLADEKGFATAALTYARRAERSLGPKDSPAAQRRVLNVLADVLEKAGKKDDLQQVQARLKKLDFTVRARPYAGRGVKSDRVVLAELFSNAHDPQCVAADLAFAALARTYRPSEVVLLRYPTNIGDSSDVLAGPATENRLSYYQGTFRALPAVLFNGKFAGLPRGGRDDAPERYDEFVEAIEPQLETPPKAKIKLSATRKGDKVTIIADVSDVRETGDDVRLRVALVEAEVPYKGKAGVATQVSVVRALPIGEDDVALKDKALKKTFTVDLGDLRQRLQDYQKKVAEKRPYPDKERPLALKDLRVVAFVQNDQSAEVLQAAQADVKGE